MFRISPESRKRLTKAHVARTLASDLRPLAHTVSCDEEQGRISVCGAGGQCARLLLNDEAKLEQVITPLGRTTRFAYRDGRLASVCSPTGLVTSLEYDQRGLLSAIVSSHGRQDFAYDEASRLVLYRAGSRSLSLTWAAENRLVGFRDGCGQRTLRRYDEAGAVVEIRDPRALGTRMKYGAFKEPEQVLHPDLTEESFRWREDSFSHDIDGRRYADVQLGDQGRLSSVEYADGHSISFRYHAQRIAEASSPEAKVCFGYDEHARIAAETTGDRAVRFEYSPDHQLVALHWPDESAVHFDYDPDGRVAKVRDWNGGVQSFFHGNHEQPLLRRLPNGLEETHERDDAGQVRATGISRGGRWLWYERYERDADQRLSRRTDTREGARTLCYDGEGRLLRVATGDASRDESYTYDANGNRTHGKGIDVEVDTRNRPIRAGDAHYSYCARGNRVKDVSARGTARYTYNGQNLLTKVETPAGTVEYAYDAFARRVRKTSGDATTTFVWAGHHLIQEIRDSPAGRSTREYVYWPGTHTPLAMREGGAVYFYHCDHLGTPQLLTDSAGRIVWSASYDAFGGLQIAIEEVENPLRFAGQYHDLETGLYYNRARYYDPRLGCYLSIDPAAPFGTPHGYQYVGNNPVNLVDPLGLWGEDWPGWAKTTAAVAAGIAVGFGVGALAVLAAPALGIAAAGSALAVGIGVVAGGIAAGTTGSGIHAYLNDGCVPCALLSGAAGGLLGSLPFLLALPGMALAGAGVFMALGFVGLGAAGGALDYIGEWAASQLTSAPQPWSLEDLSLAMGTGAATAGIARWAGPRLASARAARARAKGAPPPSGPFDVPADLDVNPDAVYGYSPKPKTPLTSLGDFTDPAKVAKGRQDRIAYRNGLEEKRKYARSLKRQGASDAEIARKLNEKRNADRAASYTDDARDKLYQRNLQEYGRKEGPSYEMLRDGYTKPNGKRVKGRADAKIVESAMRDNRSANTLVGLEQPGAQTPASAAGSGASTALAEPEDY